MLIAAALTVATYAGPSTAAASRRHPECHSRRCDLQADRAWARHHLPKYTGYVVAGATSVFGYLTGDSEGMTADGGNTARPCIAIRDDSTLGHWFMVTVGSHHARLLHCDWGPAAWTGRAIDITGLGAEALGYAPSAYPTGAAGVARELR